MFRKCQVIAIRLTGYVLLHKHGTRSVDAKDSCFRKPGPMSVLSIGCGGAETGGPRELIVQPAWLSLPSVKDCL